MAKEAWSNRTRGMFGLCQARLKNDQEPEEEAGADVPLHLARAGHLPPKCFRM